MHAALLPPLAIKLESLSKQLDEIPTERRKRLALLSEEIRGRCQAELPVLLNFVCTHNSRRSQFAQVWATVAAFVHGVPGVSCYSGGTETTAFNPRAVAALARAGFEILAPAYEIVAENPHYLVRYAREAQPLTCFSKVYDDPGNPGNNFLAVMTCSEADQHCPIIPGARRVSLLYHDPKVADGTPSEASRYDERSDQIARELLWVFREVSKNQNIEVPGASDKIQ